MNKALYQFCQNKFKTLAHGRLKLSSLLIRLHEDYTFGRIESGYLYFSETDRMSLIERIRFENGVHLLRDPYPKVISRQQIAKTQRNEKSGSYAVSRDFVLINSLEPVKINQQQLPVNSFSSLGVYLKSDEIMSVEHNKIVLVENLEIMANLSVLNIPKGLKSALWVYRGDIKKQQQTSSAYQFFRRFTNSHQLICFADLDPKGIEIALTCGAHYWLTAEDSSVVSLELQGDEFEWFKQSRSVKYLKDQDALPEKCQLAFTVMCNQRNTLKQEHMLAHNIKLNLYKL